MKHLPLLLIIALSFTGVLFALRYHNYTLNLSNNKITQLTSSSSNLSQQLADSKTQYSTLEASYSALQNIDQIKVNRDLKNEITQITLAYNTTVKVYEKILTLRETYSKTTPYEETLSKILTLLAQQKYPEAQGLITKLNQDLDKKNQELAAATSVPIPANVKESNVPPASGYARQKVNVNGTDYLVDIISADLKTTKVVVDTSSPGDCRDNCPVNMLADFSSRSNAFAAINGPYFCPATYPSCVGKTNSFDTLLMNKNKTYFNSDNNVYSSVPAAIFSTTSRFVAKSSEWGRDTGVDSVIAGQPLLVFDGESKFGGDSDPKKSSVGSRSFIGASDSTVYIGVVRGATVAQAAQVIAKMGIKNAINLDSGASTGLMSGGKYLITPSRATPFGILLVRR